MNGDKEVGYLTGIRGIAVLLVLFAHMFPSESFSKVIAYLGMSLFFVLSGCVLTYVWGNRFLLVKNNYLNFIQTGFSFLWARFARLAPLYLLVAIPYFVSSGRPWEEVSALIPRYLLGMQSWFYDLTNGGAVKQLLVYALSWSISSEVWLYLVFPLLLIFLCSRKKTSRWLIIISAFLLYCGTLIYVTKKGIYSGTGYPPSQTKFDWFVYLSPYGRIFEFIAGMLTGLILLETNRPETNRRSLHGLFALLILILMVLLLSRNQAAGHLTSTLALLRMSPLFTLPLCYLMFALARGNDVTENIFSNIVLLNVGKWSYSIYLLGGYGVPLFGGFWMPGTTSLIIKEVTQFVMILLFSAGSYQLIEVPARRFLLQLNPVKKFFFSNLATEQRL